MVGVEGQKDRYARTFDVLELLAGHPEGLTVTEIATRLQLPVSSSHNLLGRMATSEVVSVSDGPRYSLGPRAVRLGIRIADGLEVRALARRHLQELARTTGEDVYLAVRLGRRITYVERVAGSRPVTVEIRLGQDLYLHATAVGKLFAASDDGLRRRLWSRERPRLTEHTLVTPEELTPELDAVREAGVAVSREEAIIGVVGIAVGVHDAHADLVAAVHVSALRPALSDATEAALTAAARACAVAIERDLGRSHPAGR